MALGAARARRRAAADLAPGIADVADPDLDPVVLRAAVPSPAPSPGRKARAQWSSPTQDHDPRIAVVRSPGLARRPVDPNGARRGARALRASRPRGTETSRPPGLSPARPKLPPRKGLALAARKCHRSVKKSVVRASLVLAPVPALAPAPASARRPGTALARAPAPARHRRDRTATRRRASVTAPAQTASARPAAATRTTSLLLSYIGLLVYSLYDFVTSMIVNVFLYLLTIRINIQCKLDYTSCSFHILLA